MPKETIYGDGLPYGTPDEPGPARSVVELSWSREAEHVQLVTKCVEAASGETYRPKPGPVETRIREVLDPAGLVDDRTTSTGGKVEIDGHDLDLDFHDGFYVDLNRDGINRLIRNLRRARDQAFGRDE